MISFKRDNTDAVVNISIDVPFCEKMVFAMCFKCGTAEYAGLLTEAMKQQVGAAISAARKEAYEQGWRNAKAKRGKEGWFRSVI